MWILASWYHEIWCNIDGDDISASIFFLQNINMWLTFDRFESFTWFPSSIQSYELTSNKIFNRQMCIWTVHRWTGWIDFNRISRTNIHTQTSAMVMEKKRKMSCCHKKINFRQIKNYSWQKTKTKGKSIDNMNEHHRRSTVCLDERFHLSHSLVHNACLLILIAPISMFIFKLDTKYTCEYGISS